jgi:acyl carrier protein
MEPEHALSGLDPAGDHAVLAVLDVDWVQFLSANRRERDPFFEELVRANVLDDLFGQVSAAPLTRRRTMLVDAIDDQARVILGTDGVKRIDPRRPLRELGLDSLMAVELRNALGARLGRTLPATLLFDYPAIDNVADYVLRELFADEQRPVPGDPAADSAMERAQHALDIEELDHLSAEEAEQLLLAELDAQEESRR